jgi:hydroxyacylglutathione hydrolase
MEENIRWETIVSQPFAENSYVVHRNGARECFILDPGFEPELIERFIDSANLIPIAVLNTHGHSDHIAGNAAMKRRWPDCPLIIGERDADKLVDPTKNLSAGYGVALTSPAADQTVRDGETLQLAGIPWQVVETPGHSVGHVVFVHAEHNPPIIFGGDVLFQGSIGRTDFPDGSFEDLVASIHNKLFTLPDESIVLPGHGPATTIGDEKHHNPFVGRPAGYGIGNDAS